MREDVQAGQSWRANWYEGIRENLEVVGLSVKLRAQGSEEFS